MTKKTCGCEAPFRLFLFPSKLRNGEKRKKWTELMRRQTVNKTAWEPCDSDRVCNQHFVDGIPTFENPNPTLKLGYELKEVAERRSILKHPLKKKCNEPIDHKIDLMSPPISPFFVPPTIPPTPQEVEDVTDQPTLYSTNEVELDAETCLKCKEKDQLINSYRTKIDRLTRKLNYLRTANKKIGESSKPFSIDNIKTDEKMRFYTGIESIILFQTLFKIFEVFLPSVTYWRGTKKVVSTKVKSRRFFRAPSKKLDPKNELLLTLMKLRLGLLTEDLADRFSISVGTCSETIKTWVRFLAETLGKLVKWVPKEAVMENMPKAFKKAGYGNVRVIIDCSEIFIERPKSLEAQAITWSDYKSHNTIKFLIGITPTGFISFLSDCYGGRASDKFICKDSGFFDALDFYNNVMADRGFQIQEELILKYCIYFDHTSW